MKKQLTFILFGLAGLAFCQSNTAVTSGSIGKCAVWDHPYILYNNAAASQIVNTGVTVTVDQNRNIGAVNFNGTGAMDITGTNAIILSGSGSEINCRWDISSYGNYTVVNNTGVATREPFTVAAFFTAPYTGFYAWRKSGTWTAALSGAYRKGNVSLYTSYGTGQSIFGQDESGSCGIAPGGTGTGPVNWINAIGAPMASGDQLVYRAGTAYSTDPACSDTQLAFTVGTAYVTYDN